MEGDQSVDEEEVDSSQSVSTTLSLIFFNPELCLMLFPVALPLLI